METGRSFRKLLQPIHISDDGAWTSGAVMEVVRSGQILDIYLKVKLIEFSDGFDNEV